MVATQETLFYFPPPPADDAVEWTANDLGLSNTITRTKSRTAYYDKNLDADPPRREALLQTARAFLRDGAAGQPPVERLAVIHGVTVRVWTNSPHLADFWDENWYSPAEWRAATGQPPDLTPRVTVYALVRVPGQPEAAYYSRARNTIVFFNSAYYGQLKSWVLGAVGRILADEYGIHSVHGACVALNGQGVLYIAPTGTGKSTSSYGLMAVPGARFHSDDWVYIHYTLARRDGERLAPVEIVPEGGPPVRGYRCFRWLAEHPGGRGRLRGLTLANRLVECSLEALDPRAPIVAYAYISEKLFYLRTNLVESFPESAYQILRSKLENVPLVTPAFLAAHRATLDDLVTHLRTASPPAMRAFFQAMPEERLREVLARLFAFDNARAMLDITQVLGRERVYTDPLEPVPLRSVFLLRRDFEDPVVLERLSPEEFIGRLLIGETPEKKREVAYNAYRAVDDVQERQWIAALEAQARQRGAPVARLFWAQPDIPDSLREEFALFEVLYRAADCYGLNTILQKDPSVPDKATAVQRTIRLIARAVQHRPPQSRYTLADYHRLFIP